MLANHPRYVPLMDDRDHGTVDCSGFRRSPHYLLCLSQLSAASPVAFDVVALIVAVSGALLYVTGLVMRSWNN